MTYFIIDLDGTTTNASKRMAEAGKEPDRSDKVAYLAWLDRIQNAESLLADDVVKGMQSLIWALKGYGTEIYFVTSREEKWREVTEKWLRKHDLKGIKLYMRPNNDWRSYGQLKEGIIDTLTQQYPGNVLVIDDDPAGDLQEVCKRRGWTMLKAVAGGV